MGRKVDKVYETLIRGLSQGLASHDLYDFISSGCAVSSNKRICKASLMAMSDARFADRGVLEHVYSIAADRRLHA